MCRVISESITLDDSELNEDDFKPLNRTDHPQMLRTVADDRDKSEKMIRGILICGYVILIIFIVYVVKKTKKNRQCTIQDQHSYVAPSS